MIKMDEKIEGIISNRNAIISLRKRLKRIISKVLPQTQYDKS